MQEAGKTLDEIRDARPDTTAARRANAPAVEEGSVERALWRRLTLAPGVELHVDSNVRLPPPGRLQELAAWCRLHLAPNKEDEGNDA